MYCKLINSKLITNMYINLKNSAVSQKQPFRLPSSWATKVSTIGQQALLGAEGGEESQGHKAIGIHRP